MDRTEMLMKELEGFLDAAYEAVSELDALVRAELGGDSNPIGRVQTGFAQRAVLAIREAGEELRPTSRLATQPSRRIGRVAELLAIAADAVAQLNAKLCLLRGRGEDGGQSNSARIALAALRMAGRKLDLLAENLGA